MSGGEPDWSIPRLGPARVENRLGGSDGFAFVEEEAAIRFDDRRSEAAEPGWLELAGPRRRLFFEPGQATVGIVTCGGLCPGINDVIRGLVMEAWHRYGIRRVLGFRFGYQGLAASYGHPVLELDPGAVREIHRDGGSLLASSRGPQEPAVMADRLQGLGVDVLFVIGGDGTMRGALALAEELDRREAGVAVVGIPKTIDNDLLHLDRSFGFQTAGAAAVDAVYGAHAEATGTPRGVGLVKLMGRLSGFIAAWATLATSEVNFCLIPEVPFRLDGEGGLLEALGERLDRRGHAVLVVAEGAGQKLLPDPGETDASGNPRLGDIGLFLSDRIGDHFSSLAKPVSLKYIDPSYMIRSVPATPADSVYCWQLAQHAVHAALSGRTRCVIGLRHNRMVHLPMATLAAGRQRVDPGGSLWTSVLESTGQPALAGASQV